MKKLLVVLLALTVLGIFAFADDMAPAPAPIGTFTSWNTATVALYQSVNGATASTTWLPYWDTVHGIDQEWEFGYHGKNYQFYADLEFGMDNFGNVVNGAGQGQGFAGENASINRFSTTYDVVPGMLAVEIGKPRSGRAPGALAEGGSLGNFYLNSNFGADLQLLPISGFSATVFNYIPAGTNVPLSASFTGVVEYNMPNVFDINMMVSSINDEFTGGITITAIKPATFVLAWDYLQPTSTTTAWISGGGKFIPNLETDLDVAFKDNTNTSTTSIEAEAKAEYSFTAMYAFGVRVGYSDGKGAGLWGTNLGDIEDLGGVLVYPYVKANFDNGSYVSLGVSYESGANNNGSILQIPLSYVWSF